MTEIIALGIASDVDYTIERLARLAGGEALDRYVGSRYLFSPDRTVTALLFETVHLANRILGIVGLSSDPEIRRLRSEALGRLERLQDARYALTGMAR